MLLETKGLSARMQAFIRCNNASRAGVASRLMIPTMPGMGL